MIFRHNIYKDILDCGPNEEPFLLENAKYAYFYAKDKLRRRWPAAETIILESLEHSVLYAKNVIKGRWPEFEEIAPLKQYYRTYGINSNDNEWFFFYVKNVMKKRWPEVERKIIKSKKIQEYTRYLKTDEDKQHYNNLLLTEGIKAGKLDPWQNEGGEYVKKSLNWEPTHNLSYNRTKTEAIIIPVRWLKLSMAEGVPEQYQPEYEDYCSTWHRSWSYRNQTPPTIFWTLISCEDSEECSKLVITRKDFMEDDIDPKKFKKNDGIGDITVCGGDEEPTYEEITGQNTLSSRIILFGGGWNKTNKYKNLGKVFIEKDVLYCDLKPATKWSIEEIK